MKILKKNQLTLLVISLMLITAGYLNYDASFNHETQEVSTTNENSIDLASIGDAELVNANLAETNHIETYIEENIIEETNTNVQTNKADNYFTTSKLERNVMYSQMIERYQEILNSSSGMTQQKNIAQEEINKINNIQNAIMIAENLLTTKGFTESIIFVNGESISVIIGKPELTPDEIAQIQNIISRELNSDVNNIHISTK